MADIAIDATQATTELNIVEKTKFHTAIAAEAITVLGGGVRLDANGKWVNGNGLSAGEANCYGIGTKIVGAGEALTAVAIGKVAGYDFSSQDPTDIIYLSDTDATLADAAGTVSKKVGRVVTRGADTLGGTGDAYLDVNMQW